MQHRRFLFLPSFTRPGMKLSRCVIGERFDKPKQIILTFVLSSGWSPRFSSLYIFERVYDYGGADNNSVNERDYDRKWFIHVGKCMLGNGTKLAGVTIDGCLTNLTGKNGGFLKQIQDKTTERIQNWSWYFCSVLHTRRCSVTSC